MGQKPRFEVFYFEDFPHPFFIRAIQGHSKGAIDLSTKSVTIFKDPTHYLGNLLAVVITKQESKFVHSTPDVFDQGFCNLKGKPSKDHSAVMFTVNVYQLQIQSRNVSSEN